MRKNENHAALLCKGTGIKGNQRIHGGVIAVRAVESKNAMTASAMQLPWSLLSKIESRITGEISSVARVVIIPLQNLLLPLSLSNFKCKNVK